MPVDFGNIRQNEELPEDSQYNIEEIDEDNQNPREDLTVNFIKEIEMESQIDSSIIGNRDSAYYAPDLIKHLKRYCHDFPLWTAVMQKHFKSPFTIASSASVESDFIELKNQILLFVVCPLTADRFVVRHIQIINQNAKLFRNKQLQLICEIDDMDYNDSKGSSERTCDLTEIDGQNISFKDCKYWHGKGIHPTASLKLKNNIQTNKRPAKYMDSSQEIKRIVNKS